MPQMFTPSFFRTDVQPPPQRNPAMSPVSITARSNSDENNTVDTPTTGTEKEISLSKLQIPDSSFESDEKREKARKAAKYLKLIVHCQRCNGKCKTLVCKNTRLLLNHCAPCLNREKCPIKGCFQTKKLLCHMIACRFERKQARKAGLEPKYCNLCSSVDTDSAADDDQPQDSLSPNGQERRTLDMDGSFARPTGLPRRFRSSTQGNMNALSLTAGTGMATTPYNCRSFSVEEESEEMEEESMAETFRSRRVSI